MASKARGLADLGNAFNDGALSNRNLIINGACNVQQRAASTTTHASYGTVDRMILTCGVTGTTTLDAGTVASGTEPYALGFRNTARLTNTVAGSDAAADYAAVGTFLEAQNVATSGWDYTSASGKMTLSFWVKSSVAGTYTARLEAFDVVPTTKNYSISFTVSANTWTKVVKTISGNSALQFDMDANVGLGLYIWAYIGSNYTTSTNPVDTWADLDGADQTLDHPQNWKAVSGATLEVTGLMLEVGDTATPFEHRSYGQELALCQRYYQTYIDPPMRGGVINTNTLTRIGMTYVNPMRATPTLVMTGTANIFDCSTVTTFGPANITAVYLSTTKMELDATTLTSTLIGGRPAILFNNAGSSTFALSAEL